MIEMTKNDFDFETWFDCLTTMVLDGCGVDFRDEASVRSDYDEGKNCADVAEEIIAEYNIE